VAHIFRPVAVKPIPKGAVVKTIDGKRVATWTNRRNRKVTAELTPDGARCRVHSPTWWIEYTTSTGGRDRAKGYRDRSATLQLAAELERGAEDIRAGRESPKGAAPERLANYIESFRDSLARKGRSVGHIDDTVKQIRRVIDSLHLGSPGTVDREEVERWLDAQQRRAHWGARTRNQWTGSLNQFGRWLVKEKKSKVNPFDGLARQNVETDRRYVRRVLAPDDLARLVTAARDSGKTIRGLTGFDRAWLYTLAAYTGRRLRALKLMTAADVAWTDGKPVTITSSARLQKSKRTHVVPLHPDLADDLAAWLATRPRHGPLFVGCKKWDDRAADIVRHDLATARAAWIEEAGTDDAERARREASDRLLDRDHAGEVFDFHSLRGQFITSLALAGVPLTAAQQLADHSDPKLTAGAYTKWKNKLAAEVAKLPAPAVRLGSGSGLVSELGSAPGSHGGVARQTEPPQPARKRKSREKQPVSRGS
jgi:integrase